MVFFIQPPVRMKCFCCVFPFFFFQEQSLDVLTATVISTRWVSRRRRFWYLLRRLDIYLSSEYIEILEKCIDQSSSSTILHGIDSDIRIFWSKSNFIAWYKNCDGESYIAAMRTGLANWVLAVRRRLRLTHTYQIRRMHIKFSLDPIMCSIKRHRQHWQSLYTQTAQIGTREQSQQQNAQ